MIEAPPHRARLPVIARRLVARGPDELRDLERTPRFGLEQLPVLPAPQIRALRQLAGSAVRWQVELGERPYLSIVPLGTDSGCAGCGFRLLVEDGAGREHELLSGTVTPRSNPSAATTELDLGPFAGRSVAIVARVEAGEQSAGSIGAMLWGSPGVYSRRWEENAAKPARDSGPVPPSVLLLGADTLRADALGVYGRRPSLTPALDRLAAESDVWLDAFSAFNVTVPSFLSLMTGLYGKSHGVYGFDTGLAPEHETLAERFRSHGYATLAIVAAHHLRPDHSGLGQGFETVTTTTSDLSAELVVDMAMDWMAERQLHAQPFFAWLHLFDPHVPHAPPEPFGSGRRPATAYGLDRVAEWVEFRDPGHRAYEEPALAGHVDLYAGEVAYLDRQVDRLLGFLRSRDLLSSTIVVFTSDHGENLGEHGLYCRHAGLWDTTTHVPLIVRWPGRGDRGRRIPGLVQSLDIYPTLLGAAGIEVPPQEGLDLLQITGEGRRGRPAVFSEHAHALGVSVRTAELRYYRSIQHGLMPGGELLYDLELDPAESRDLSAERPEAVAALAERLARWQAVTPGARVAPYQSPLSPQERERLGALGYTEP